MGLLKILKKIKRKEKEMRVLMLGLDNAGRLQHHVMPLISHLSQYLVVFFFFLCVPCLADYSLTI